MFKTPDVDKHADKHHEELRVERTTPQGTQENGVERGHENRDVKMKPLFRWFGGLAVLTFGTFLLIYGMFTFFLVRETKKDVLPSRMFAEEVRPPKPLLLPRPWEHLKVETQAERRRLSDPKELSAPEAALVDPKTGNPKLPPNAVSMVGPQQPGGTNQTFNALSQSPSDASGGRAPDWNVQ
ncbi:MAG: hypothetical protein M3347_00120 [Armatimonadota bacterium]|nr:hypothetical protein [Armatimonadota bacterium]